MIEFGQWLPDQSDLGNSGVLEAKNVYPAARGYRPARDMSQISGAADAYIRGIYATHDASDVVQLFAGDSTKTYKYDSSDSSLANVSKSGNYTLDTDDKWKFVQFGEYVIGASGYNQILQQYQIGTSTLFADISGAPAAKYMAVVRDFVVCGNVSYGSTNYQERLYWSSINDSQSWTIGTDQSDIQDIPDSGKITAVIGGQTGTVLLERGIARIEYVGTPLIFTVERVETNNGCEIPGSVVALGSTAVFYLSPNGFFMFDGSRSVPIGSEKVDQWFYDNFNTAFPERMTAAVDPNNQVVCWSFVSNDSNDGEPDKILVYNYAVGKWSLIELSHESLGTVMIPGYSLEQLDNINSSIDAMTTSFDSPLYKGESFVLGGSKDQKIQSFTGDILDATIISKEFEIAPMRSSVINSITPYVTAKNPAVQPTLSVSVGSRSRQIDDVSFTSAGAITSDNLCNVRSSGRYHRVKVETTGDFRYALGIDVDAKPLGRR
jgi:hypothetical protein